MAVIARVSLQLSLSPHKPPLLFTTTTTTLAAKRHKPHQHQHQHHHHQQQRSTTVLNCIFSGVDGSGGVADEFISTRKSDCSRREFSVILDMLKRVEPFDTTLISNGVSSSAKESMKRTISDMLGLLPSDQFSVVIRVSRTRVDLLLTETILTGYTLWNAEYRVSLMRNFSISDGAVSCNGWSGDGGVHDEDIGDGGMPQSLGELSPEALSYIQQLKTKLASLQKERDSLKQVNMPKEFVGEADTNLLQYLRSFQPDMVSEISRPSSPEVQEIIHQLVQNVLQRLFSDDTCLRGDSIVGKTEKSLYGSVELLDTISISRDYLAKLLFWCMLLGHHLKGLENRLHLSCAVGLL